MVVSKQPKNNRKNDFEETVEFDEDFNENGFEKDLKKDLSDEEGKGDVNEQVSEKNELNNELNLEIENLKKELDSFKDVNLRLKAEFENFKKRTQKEKRSIYDMAKSDCVAPFLEVLDNLERALGLVEKKDKFSEGIDLVVNKFYDVLKKIGVCEIKSFGEVFDPNFHEAVMQTPTSEHPEHTVIAELRKGYKYGDKVLRATMVNVATAE